MGVGLRGDAWRMGLGRGRLSPLQRLGFRGPTPGDTTGPVPFVKGPRRAPGPPARPRPLAAREGAGAAPAEWGAGARYSVRAAAPPAQLAGLPSLPPLARSRRPHPFSSLRPGGPVRGAARRSRSGDPRTVVVALEGGAPGAGREARPGAAGCRGAGSGGVPRGEQGRGVPR